MADKLKWIIEVDDDGSPVIRRFGNEAGDALDRVDKNSKTTAGSMGKLKAAIVALAGSAALAKLINWSKEWAQAAGVQQKAEAGLLQAMQSMGRYSPEFYGRMLETASALQEVTTFGDEATIAGQKFLMTYRQIPDELMPRATAAMLDLAALMGGDTANAANMLGKAAMGLSGELRRVGITIDADVAKGGDFAEILGEIENQVSGQAQALASTGIGPWEQMANLWGDSKEKLGDLVLVFSKQGGLLDVLRDAAALTGTLATNWKNFLTDAAGDAGLQVLKKQEEAIVGQIERIQSVIKTPAGISQDYLFGLAQKLPGLRKQLSVVRGSIERENVGGFHPVEPPPASVPGPPESDQGTGDTLNGNLQSAVDKGEFEYQVALETNTKLEEALAARHEALADMDSTYRETEMETLLASSEWKIAQDQSEAEAALAVAQWKNEQLVSYEQYSQNRMVSVTKQAAASRYQIAVGLGNAVLAFAGANSTAIFVITKALEMGLATVAAFAASNLAMAHPPGPPETLPLASAVLKAGLLNVAAIGAMALGQVAMSASSSATGAGSYTSPVVTSPVTNTYDAGGNADSGTKLEVHLHGDYFDSLESRQRLAEFLTEYVEEYGGNLTSSNAQTAEKLS